MPRQQSAGSGQKQKAVKRPKLDDQLRSYLPDDDTGKHYNADDPSTVEGKLSRPDDPLWFVPEEPPLQPKRKSKRHYKKSDFEVKSRNKFDHFEPLSLRLPDTVVNMIDALVDSHSLPLRSRRHAAAVAIIAGLSLLYKLEPQPDNHFVLLEELCAQTRDADMLLDYETTIESRMQQIRQLVRRGYLNKARVSAHQLMRTVRKIKSKEVRGQWEQSIEGEFRGIMKGVPVRVVVAAAASEVLDEGDY